MRRLAAVNPDVLIREIEDLREQVEIHRALLVAEVRGQNALRALLRDARDFIWKLPLNSVQDQKAEQARNRIDAVLGDLPRSNT